MEKGEEMLNINKNTGGQVMNTNNTTTSTFTLEIPKADTSLLKSLVKRMGWTVHKTTTKHTAYEQALNDKEQGRVNEYVSADELFSKLGI